jgi:hypothetical protein
MDQDYDLGAPGLEGSGPDNVDLVLWKPLRAIPVERFLGGFLHASGGKDLCIEPVELVS